MLAPQSRKKTAVHRTESRESFKIQYTKFYLATWRGTRQSTFLQDILPPWSWANRHRACILPPPPFISIYFGLSLSFSFCPIRSTSNERLFVCPGPQSWLCCCCHLMKGSKGHLPQSPCPSLCGAVHLIAVTDFGCVCPISKTPHSSGSLRVER